MTKPGLNTYNKWGGPSGALTTVVDNDQRSWAGSLGWHLLVHKKLFIFASWAAFTTANNSETSS